MSETYAWNAMLESYRKYAEPLAEQLARDILDRSDLPSGADLLDVCAGTGAVAVQAADDGHRVTSVDLAEGMVDVLARRLAPYPGASAQVMDVTDLGFADGSFDVALSVFGVTLFGETSPHALAEMARVVRRGGVVGVVHWADPLGAPIFELLGRAMQRLDDPEVGPAQAWGFGYPTADALADALAAVGCVDVAVHLVEGEEPLPEPDDALAELESMYLNYRDFARLTVEQRERLRGPLAEEIRHVLTHPDERPAARAFVALGRVAS